MIKFFIVRKMLDFFMHQPNYDILNAIYVGEDMKRVAPAFQAQLKKVSTIGTSCVT